MSLRERTRPGLGIIEPCLPSPAKAPPSGPGWIHEIKHDGFRIMARRDGAGIQLITRHGNDFTARFPLAVEAVSALSARSFLLDGEAIVTNERGLAVFDLIRHQRHGDDAVLIAFDLIELDGEDLRRTPIEQRKRQLAKLVRRPQAGIVLNEVFEGDGDILFAHACKLGCEGIVSKRLIQDNPGLRPSYQLGELAINAIDLRTLDRHPDAAVSSLIPALSCRSCRPNAPFAELVRLSRTSIADEMREEHRHRVLGE
jgi:ATP-dependent DNA ligase